jgi:hypothetical protein
MALQNAKTELDLKLQRSESRRKQVLQQRREQAALKLRSPTKEAEEDVSLEDIPAFTMKPVTGSWADVVR